MWSTIKTLAKNPIVAIPLAAIAVTGIAITAIKSKKPKVVPATAATSPEDNVPHVDSEQVSQ